MLRFQPRSEPFFGAETLIEEMFIGSSGIEKLGAEVSSMIALIFLVFAFSNPMLTNMTSSTTTLANPIT